MPQPIKHAHATSFGIDMALERPELATKIGVICSNWSVVEYNLVFTYAKLLEAYQSRECEDPSRLTYYGTDSSLYPVAFGIFSQINSLNGRLSVLEDLLKEVAPPKIYKEFKPLKDEILFNFRKRSEVAHGVWAICKCKEHQDALILYPISRGPQFVYKQRDLEEINNRIRDLWRLVTDFRWKTLQNLVPRTGVPPSKSN